jgi:hypothetical protein
VKKTRLFAAAAAFLLAGAMAAQAPFTIVRPVEGARVREVIKIHIPEKSVPEGGYIAIYVNGSFIEATVPQAKEGMYEYLLDSKKRGLKDGPIKIEVVLHGPTAILDRSSVNVTLANEGQIDVPAEGVHLRYRFREGSSWLYKVHSQVSLLSISEEEEKRGATAAEQMLVDDEFDLLYSIDNVYPSGNGLLRTSGVPDESGMLVFQEMGTDNMTTVQDEDLSPWYVEMTPYGEALSGGGYGWINPLGGSGTIGTAQTFMFLPLPRLPREAESTGNKWSSPVEFPTDYRTSQSGGTWTPTLPLPAEVTLVAFEWEQGHPCAHIQYKFAKGKVGDGKPLQVRGASAEQAEASLLQDVWFATDLGTVVRSDATLTIEYQSGADTGGGIGAGPGMGPAGIQPGVGPGTGTSGRGGAVPGGRGAGLEGGPGVGIGVRGGGTPTMGASGGAGLPAAGTSGKVRMRFRINLLLLD